MDTHSDFVAAAVEEFTEEEVSPPENAQQAARMLRALAALERDRAECAAVFDGELAKLQEWREDRMAGLDRLAVGLEFAIESWWRAQASERSVASLILPEGRLELGQTPPSIVLEDSVAFAGWELQQTAVEVAKLVVSLLRDAGQTPAWLSHDDAAKVVQAARESEYCRSSFEVSKTALKAKTEKGHVQHSDDQYFYAQAVLDGEIVPGVAYRTERTKRFRINLTEDR